MLIVNSITIDIDNPANTTIKLTTIDGRALTDKSITSNNKDNTKDITDVKDWLNEDYTTKEDFDKLKDWTNTKFGDTDTAIKDWTNNQISDNTNAIKDWTSNNFPTNTDLSEYAKITDVNSAFNSLATALGGL